jgi:catechol 2,3-dioxygenase-like lactoylglutathione lyase family enzyme
VARPRAPSDEGKPEERQQNQQERHEAMVRPFERFVYVLGDRQRLHVHSPEVSPYPIAQVPVRPGGSDLCFVWDGPIEDAVEHLRRNGAEILEGPVGREGAFGSGRSVYFRDPDGSLLEFISYD